MNPGPPEATELSLITVNVSSLGPHAHDLARSVSPLVEDRSTDASLVCVQEHCVLKGAQEPLRRMASAAKAQMVLTPAEDDFGKASAGVGIIADARHTVQALRMASREASQLQAKGMLGIYLCDVGASVPLCVAVLYGYPCADTDPKARASNVHLFTHTILELQRVESLPILVVGDLKLHPR